MQKAEAIKTVLCISRSVVAAALHFPGDGDESFKFVQNSRAGETPFYILHQLFGLAIITFVFGRNV